MWCLANREFRGPFVRRREYYAKVEVLFWRTLNERGSVSNSLGQETVRRPRRVLARSIARIPATTLLPEHLSRSPNAFFVIPGRVLPHSWLVSNCC